MAIIKDQFDPDLRKIIKKQKKVAVIPVGSIEQHGPHLPISTDSDIVTEVAKQVSEKCNFFKELLHVFLINLFKCLIPIKLILIIMMIVAVFVRIKIKDNISEILPAITFLILGILILNYSI